MTKKHLEYFEIFLHRESQIMNEQQVTVRLSNRSALTFVSRYLDVVKGARAESAPLRSRETSGNPSFSVTASLATSTESREIAKSERAVFGLHGFVSKILRRCYELIKNLTTINQRLSQMLGPAIHESALVDEPVDGEAERRVRTPCLPVKMTRTLIMPCPGLQYIEDD